jgi:N-methylhydantoinase A
MRIAVDVGGTFTDVILLDETTSTLRLEKVETTPHDPARGVLQAFHKAQARLSDIDYFVHGTTLGLNALLTRTGARVAIVTTKGFRDVYELGRTARDPMYDLKYRKPKTLVPRSLAFEVTERCDFQGNVVTPLDRMAAVALARQLRDLGVEAVAVCFLHSYAYPNHELFMEEVLRQECPHVLVSLSHQLSREYREYERTSTVVVDAYIKPVIRGYLAKLDGALRAEGFSGHFLLTRSGGGAMTVSSAAEQPVHTVLSGPAGGVVGAQVLSQLLGQLNLITLDMGGTSLDAALVVGGRITIEHEASFEGLPLSIPTIDISAIGAGGGSIAAVDELGILRVGPASMGAVPGPAAYNRGGSTPTVTDADVILGYIDPDHFLGGKMPISRPLAERAVATIAKPLGLDVIEAAAAVYRIVNARMADLIRRATVERGHDPRDFVMAAFGGCGPTHCAGYGPDIGALKIVVPPSATVFSAFGIGQSDLKHSWVQAFSGTLRDSKAEVVLDQLPQLNAILAELTALATEQLARDAIAPDQARFSFQADIRYRSQVHVLTVAFSSRPPFVDQDIAALMHAFQDGYERRYGLGSSSPSAPIEWVNLRLNVVAGQRTPTETPVNGGSGRDAGVAMIGTKRIYNVETKMLEPAPLYQAERLRPGQRVSGLALIVSYGTTIPLHPGQVLDVDAHNNMLITSERALKL